MWMSWLALALALASDEVPSCSLEPLPAPDEVLSVAWVSRVARKVGANTWLSVVSTTELRALVDDDKRLARMLQRLGLRRSEREPRRRYKVVVFDVSRDVLCRPIDDASPGEVIDGVAACDDGRALPRRGTAGCGYTEDTASGGTGLVLYRAQWSELARNGFCVLPAERFLR